MISSKSETARQLDDLRLAIKIAGVEVAEPALPEHRTATVGSMQFHLVEWGQRNHPTIVFLHGVGLTARTWDLVCLVLKKDYHCLALDLRGHGDSEWAANGDYGVHTHSTDVEALVDTLNLVDFVLVGHSLGGRIALSYAARQASRLRGLVMVDSSPGERNLPASGRPNQVFDFMAGPSDNSVDEFVERAVRFNPARDRRLLRRSLLHNLRQLPNGRWTWKYDRTAILRRDPAVSAATTSALWDVLPQVSCPTLVVRGGRSESLSDASAEDFATALPHGTWETVPDAGHTIQGDNPQGLVRVLIPFLSRLPSRSARDATISPCG
jgi:esterase